MTEGKAARKGFITIATGRDEYYVLAHNLLMSYRFHSRSSVPFGIICDRQNEYTADFDTVILLDDPKCSYFDKLRLPELAPFDETIFIDADCLAYRDLNGLWSIFRKGPDFGAFGTVVPLDAPEGWVPPKILEPFRDRIRHQFILQGGIYYMRKNKLTDFLQTCREIFSHLTDYRFKFETDESVFDLACMMHGYYPVGYWAHYFCYLPYSKITDMDITRGILRARQIPNCQVIPDLFLVHWGTKSIRKEPEPYGEEVRALKSALTRSGHACFLIPVRIGAERACFRFVLFIKQLIPLRFKTYLWEKIYAQNQS